LEDRRLLSVLYWDPQQSSGAHLGGPGTWSNGDAAVWYNPATKTDVAWNNAGGDAAVFQGSAGAVTVNAGVSVGGIEFDTSGYSLGGANITLTQNNNSGWLGGQIETNGTTDAIDAVLAGSVGLTKSGLGELTLTGANTYSGATAIQNGTLALAGGDNRLPTETSVTLGDAQGESGILQLGDGTTASNQSLAGLFTNGGSDNRVVGGGTATARLTLTVDSSDAWDQYDGILGGSGAIQNNLALEMDGSGVVLLTGDNSYTGGTFINSGAVGGLGSDTAFGSGTIYLNGGTFGGGLATLGNPIEVEANSTLAVVATLTLDGNISGSATISCTNYLYDNYVDGVLQLGGDNSGFAGTFVQWQTSDSTGLGSMSTYFTSASAGSANANWNIEQGVLANDVSGTPTITLGSLSGSGTLSNAVPGSTATFAVGGNNQASEFDGIIEDGSGVVNLTKTGAGELTLTGANTYSGATAIQNGTLVLAGGDNRLPTGTVVTLGDAANKTSGILQLGDGTTASNQTLAGLTTDMNNGYDATGNCVVGGGSGLATLTLNVAAGADYTFDGILGGNGMDQNNLALAMTGPGTEELGAANSYNGGTSLGAGVLQVWNAKALGSSSITATDGVLHNLGPQFYYVDPAGLGGTPNDANDGSIDHPLATLTRACQLAGPGDTIILRGATYNVKQEGGIGNSFRGGLPGLPVTIEAAPGEQPVFDEAEREQWQQDPVTGYWYADLSPSSWYSFHPHVEIINGWAATDISGASVNGMPPAAFTSPDSAYYQNGQLAFDLTWYDLANHRLWFRSNEIQPITDPHAQCGVVGMGDQIGFFGVSWVVLKGLEIENGFDGMEIAAADATHPADHITIEDCRITHMWQQGILIHGNYDEISNNYVDAVGGQLQLNDNGQVYRPWFYHDLYFESGEGASIHDNFFGRALSGGSVQFLGDSDATVTSVLANNVCYGGQSFALLVHGANVVVTGNVAIAPSLLWRGNQPPSYLVSYGMEEIGLYVYASGNTNIVVSGNYFEGGLGLGESGYGPGLPISGFVLAGNTIAGGREALMPLPPADMNSNQWGGNLTSFQFGSATETNYGGFLAWAQSQGFQGVSAGMATPLIDPTNYDAQLDTGLSFAQAMALFRNYAVAKVNDFAGGPAVAQSSTLGGTTTPDVNGISPQASNDAWRLDPGTTLAVDAAHGVLANDSDPDNESLTAVLVSEPTNGQLTFNSDGSFSYTPSANFSGTDTFTYMASDGLGGTAMATVVLNVVPLGHPVVNVTDAGGTYHGTPFPATATLTAPGNAPVSSLDGVSPTLAYYAGSLTAAQVAAAIPLPGAPSAAGTYTVVATFPGDIVYAPASSNPLTFTIAKATPAITWATPAAIPYGAALDSTQLDATADVPGSFAYNPGPGTVLQAGNGQTLSVTFTPTDAVDYSTVTATASLNVMSTIPPTVTNVLVSSTKWTTTFLSYLASLGSRNVGGYSIPVGSGSQLLTLPWGNINQIKVVFSENVTIDQSDLLLTGVNVPSYTVSSGTFTYDPSTFTATWTLPQPIGPDKLMLALNADGSDPIEDAAGDRLDGEWTNPTSPADTGGSTYPSGDGVAGGNFDFRFNVLPGDATQDGTVNVADMNKVLTNVNSTGMSWSQGDVTGDGAVDVSDLNVVLTNYNQSLPSGTPATGAFPAADLSMAATMPTTVNNPVTVPHQADASGNVVAADNSGLEATDVLAAASGNGDSQAIQTSAGAGGTYTVVAASPADTGCAASSSDPLTFTITKAAPAITSATPATVTYGAALGNTPLIATANVPGSFTYPSPAGTVLGAGSQTLPVTFPPTVTADHATTTAGVGPTVRQAGTTSAVSSSLNPSALNRLLTLSGGEAVVGTVSLSQSTLTLSAPSLVAGSAVTVTLTARDALGHQELGGGLRVAFSLGTGSAGGTFSAVTDHDNGTYTATFTGAKAGSNTIKATIAGQSVTSARPAVTVTPGPVSVSQSTISLNSATLAAGSKTTVTLTARDAYGNRKTGGGLKVVFRLGAGSAGGTFSAVTDHGNGTYTATFTRTKAGYDTVLAAIASPPVTPLWPIGPVAAV